MRDFLIKRTVKIMVAVYLVTAFLTSVTDICAYAKAEGAESVSSQNTGTSAGRNEENGDEESKTEAGEGSKAEAGEGSKAAAGEGSEDNESGKENPDTGLSGVSVNDGQLPPVSGECIEVRQDTKSISGDIISALSDNGKMDTGYIDLPVEESGTEEAAGATNAPAVTRVLLYLYDVNIPDKIISQYDYLEFNKFRYSAAQDAELPFSSKRKATFSEVSETVAKITMSFRTNNANVEYELEQVDPDTGEILGSTGRVKQNTFEFTSYALYKVHVYAMYDLDDANDDEGICYVYTGGLDKTPPVIKSAAFTPDGTAYTDKSGNTRYGKGKLVIDAADSHTGFPEYPYMAGYPDGEWTASSVILNPQPGLLTVAVRDKAGNITTTQVDTSVMDPYPPVTSLSVSGISPVVNGFCKKAEITVSADDETALANKYISFDRKNWDAQKTHTVTENGAYTVYTRDVFGNISENSVTIDKLDNTAPFTTYSIIPDMNVKGYANEDLIRINAGDNGAGLDEKAFSFDGGKSFQASNIKRVSENCVIRICTRDALKNVSECTDVTVGNIDREAPKITEVKESRKNTAGIYAGSSKISVTASDEGSGIPEKFIDFDEKGSWESDNALTVSKNGTHRIKIRDGVGNTAESVYTVSNIDAEGPTVSVSGIPAGPVTSKAVLKIEAGDGLSGLKDIYVMNSRAGVRKLIKEYKADDKGLGKKEDTAEALITANGEYYFYLTDMCGNESTAVVKITKIITPSVPTTPAEPEDDPVEDKKNEPKKDTGTGGGTVVIGSKKNTDSTNSGGSSTITVKSMAVSSNSPDETVKVSASQVKVTRVESDDTGDFAEEEEEEEIVSENDVRDFYEPGDYSTELYEPEIKEYYSQSEPKQLEAVANPDEADVTETKSNTAIIAGTVFAMVLGLSALAVFLLFKKGIIKKPDFLNDGNNT